MPVEWCSTGQVELAVEPPAAEVSKTGLQLAFPSAAAHLRENKL